MAKKQIAVIGAGPAGLMAADVLSRAGARVTIFERMPSPARKFLLAGRGGLNLTHSEQLAQFMSRYGDAARNLQTAIDAFTPDDLRSFSHELGQETFVGSSGRVFPKSFKTSPLLRTWLRRLAAAGVEFRFRHRWDGWSGEGVRFTTPDGQLVTTPDAVVLALGGASWPQLGSDGGWVDALVREGADVAPLRPANSGFSVAWSEHMRAHAGDPLKGLALSFDGVTVRGEAVITERGIEGGGIYALSGRIRDAIVRDGEATLRLALRPDIATADLVRRLDASRGKRSMSNHLRKTLHLSSAETALLNEAAALAGAPLSRASNPDIAERINDLPIRLIGTAPIARAISSAGGVRFSAVDDRFMLRTKPGVFVAGEMLDWEAPTGGYLLQASFATGAAAGQGVLRWLS